MEIIIIYSVIVSIVFLIWLTYIIRVYDQNFRKKE